MTQTLIEKLEALPRYDQIEGWIHPDDNALERVDDGEYVEYRRICAIIEEHKRESGEAFDLSTGLNAVADMGFWPQVIYDGNGNWAIWDEGSANMGLDDEQDYHCSFLIPASYFRPSLQEAWLFYVDRLKELGNDVANLKILPSPQPSNTQLIGELVDALEETVAIAEAHIIELNCTGPKALLSKVKEMME